MPPARTGGHRGGRPSSSQRSPRPLRPRTWSCGPSTATVELEGNLIAYDGAYYQIETVYGPLTVSAEGVFLPPGPAAPI